MSCSSPVVEVAKTHLILDDGTKSPCGLVLWSTGHAPRPFLGEF